MEPQAINTLISEQLSPMRKGHGLARGFYREKEIYERDLERIFLRSWIYAGHVSEFPKVGDYALFDLADESVIIVRSGEGGFSALVNVCRHRGSRICLEPNGNRSRFVCPYHAWTYDLDGTLLHARHMPEDFDRSTRPLKRIHLHEFHGMLFVNFAHEPAPFEPIADALDECLAPYDLAHAKVAHRHTYRIEANWKLALENYTECYHCAPSHPEYSRGHSLAAPGARDTEEMRAVMDRAAACGLSEQFINRTYADAEGFGADYAFERYPLLKGQVTGSQDGAPVAPLLGEIKDYDGGTTDFQIGPVTFALAYCDHVVIYRFTPRGVDSCDCDITWLVNGTAEAGRDYDRKALTWLWDVTTIADNRIIEDTQAGVNSRFFEPGPFSEMETFTRRFTEWYLAAIS